jgi:hypothetical protein
MAHRFDKHYSLAEARELLPRIRLWLARLVQLRAELEKRETALRPKLSAGHDLGGELVNALVETMAEIQDVLLEFYQREIQIKDLDRGLVDFPAFIDGKEAFLCWEQLEPDIAFWHELDSGYAGRQRVGNDKG